MPKLQVSGVDKSQIIVLEFKGKQAISELYHFNIEFVSKTSISASQVINQKAQLIFAKKGGGTTPLNGEVVSFAQLDDFDDYHRYKILLMPKVHRLQHIRKTEVFLDKSVPQVIKKKLNDNGITQVELDLITEHKPKEFIFQYNEIDWNFITRWMEFEGLFYYFSQDENGEKLVITDNNSTLKNNQDINEIYYQSYKMGSESSSTANLVYNFELTTETLPKQVIVKSYYYEQSSKPYTSKMKIDETGHGDVMFWAENIKSSKENQQLAKYISESYKCKKEILSGISSGSLIIPGTIINHKNFKISSLNTSMLIIESTYSGSQKNSYASLHSGEEHSPADHFKCEYRAINKSTAYRRPIQNNIPRIPGMLPGFIDHEGDDNQVQINKKGLYKFRIAISEDKPGKGSGWVRKMESYLGDRYSFALPLRKGDEVLIGFQFGNPDLPIIVGSVNNSTHRSVLTSQNQNYMGLYTKEHNMFFMNEQEGETQGIQCSTPNKNTMLTLGTDDIFKSQLDAGYFLTTDGNVYERIGKSRITNISDNRVLSIDGNETKEVWGISDFACKQAAYYSYLGAHSVSVSGLDFMSRMGASITATSGFQVNLTSGWRYDEDKSTSLKTAPVILQEAETSISLKVGTSAIIITEAGITIDAPTLEITSPSITMSTMSMNVAPGNVNIAGVVAAGNLVELGPGVADEAIAAAEIANVIGEAELVAASGSMAIVKAAANAAWVSVSDATSEVLSNANKILFEPVMTKAGSLIIKADEYHILHPGLELPLHFNNEEGGSELQSTLAEARKEAEEGI